MSLIQRKKEPFGLLEEFVKNSPFSIVTMIILVLLFSGGCSTSPGESNQGVMDG